MEYKFHLGDKVKVIRGGQGVNKEKDGNKIVKIVEKGYYNSDCGYVVDPPIGNSASGEYDGFIGEESFELVAPDIKSCVDILDKLIKQKQQ